MFENNNDKKKNKHYDSVFLEKSKIDDKEYNLITFNSGFRLLNIIDKKTDISSAAMMISVGSIHEELYLKNKNSIIGNGIVHFLEHMLFIENSTYPIDKYGVDYFQQYIATHGGMSNASTYTGYTKYYFAIQSIFLFEALKIFLHFFIDPTFNSTFVEKEQHAVHNEYTKNIGQEVWQICDIISKLSINHPFKHFTTGNLYTLFNDKNDTFILQQLRNIFDDFYIQKNMILVIYHNSNLFVENNEEFVNKINMIRIESTKNDIDKKMFDIAFDNLTKQINEHPLKHENNIMINMETNKCTDKLVFVYQVDKYDNDMILYKPIEYIKLILTSYHENSMYNILLKMNLISNINLDIFDSFGKTTLFAITFTLSEDGYKKKDYITSVLFSLFESNIIEEQLYETNRKIHKYKYDNDVSNDPLENVIDLAYNLYNYDTNIITSHNAKMYKFNKEVDLKLKNYLNNLRKKSCVIIFISKKNNIVNSDKYFPEKINNNEIYERDPMTITWHNARYNIDNSFGKNKNVKHLINKLQLLFDDRCITHSKLNIKLNKIDKYPVKIKHDCSDKICVWKRQDNKYGVEKCCVGIIISSQIFGKNIESFVLMILFCMILNEEIKKYLNCVLKLDFKINVSIVDNNLIITIDGYNTLMPNVVNVIIFLITNNANNAKEFIKSCLYQYISYLTNIKYEQSHLMLDELLKENIIKNYYSFENQLKILKSLNVTEKKLVGIITKVLKKSKIKCLIDGNICETGINNIINHLKMFDIPDVDNNTNKNNVASKISDKYIINICNSKNVDEVNNSVAVYYQIDYVLHDEENIKKKLICDIFTKAIGNDFFSVLRTEKQFGYYVRNNFVPIGNIENQLLHYVFKIQSNHKTINDINDEIILYVDNLKNKLNSQIENIEEIKTVIINEINSKYNNYFDEFNYYFNKIICNTTLFDEKAKMLKLIEKIKKEDILDFYNNYFQINEHIYVIGVEKNKII